MPVFQSNMNIISIKTSASLLVEYICKLTSQTFISNFFYYYSLCKYFFHQTMQSILFYLYADIRH